MLRIVDGSSFQDMLTGR